MPPRKRGRKAKKTRTKKEKDPFAEEKKLKCEALLEEYDQMVENKCNAMKANLLSTCSNLQILYDMALLAIPPEQRKMTKKQYNEKLKSKSSNVDQIVDNGIFKLFDLPSSVVSRFESCLASTAKKKKKRLNNFTCSSKAPKKLPKDSINTSIASIRTTRRALAQMQETVTPISRQIGLPVNHTPKVKKPVFYSNTPSVTPKFDPRKPLLSAMLRKPKAGEIVMSLSGSPLQIPSVDVSSKPGIMVSFGGGRVLNVADPSGFRGLEMNLDQSTKQTLRLVNEKLAKVLAS